MIWETHMGKSISKHGYFGIPRNIVNLRRIADKNRRVRFLINGKSHRFHVVNDDTNRVSGIDYEVRRLFKNRPVFECEYDSQKKIFIINLTDVVKSFTARGVSKDKGTPTVVSSLIEMLDRRVKGVLKKELKNYRIFSEIDIQAIIYWQLRQVIADDKISIRCEPTVRNRKKPDIIVLYGDNPIVVIEIKCFLWTARPLYKPAMIADDVKKLKQFIRMYRSLKRCYLIAVYDTDIKNEYTFRTGDAKYREILINLRRLPNYKKWRECWEYLREPW